MSTHWWHHGQRISKYIALNYFWLLQELDVRIHICLSHNNWHNLIWSSWCLFEDLQTWWMLSMLNKVRVSEIFLPQKYVHHSFHHNGPDIFADQLCLLCSETMSHLELVHLTQLLWRLLIYLKHNIFMYVFIMKHFQLYFSRLKKNLAGKDEELK